MCDNCLDLVDAVVGEIATPIKGYRKEMQKRCEHVPFCAFRALRPAERQAWMQAALPRTFTIIAMKARS